jgi:hypothetical protein
MWDVMVPLSLNVGCDGPIIRLVEKDSPFLFFSSVVLIEMNGMNTISTL